MIVRCAFVGVERVLCERHPCSWFEWVLCIPTVNAFDGEEWGVVLGDGAGALLAFGAEFLALGLEDFVDELFGA